MRRGLIAACSLVNPTFTSNGHNPRTLASPLAPVVPDAVKYKLTKMGNQEPIKAINEHLHSLPHIPLDPWSTIMSMHVYEF